MTHPFYDERKIGWIFGWHGAGVNGDYSGISEYIAACRASGNPVNFYSVDHAGIISAEIMPSYQDHDNIGFRFTEVAGEKLDTIPIEDGRYVGDPAEFFASRYNRVHELYPSDLLPYRDRIYTTYVNEPNTHNYHDMRYLAEGALTVARLSIRDNRRYAAWGWAGGNPEPEFWQLPETLEFLRLAELHPHLIAIKWHLYSFDNTNLFYDYNYQVQRYLQMYRAAEDHGIAPAKILAGETGWGEDSMLARESSAMAQLDKAQSDMVENRFWGGCMLWTKGDWHGTIVKDMQSIDPMVTDRARNYEGVTIPKIGEEMDCSEFVRDPYNRIVHVASPAYCSPEQRAAIYQKVLDPQSPYYGNTVGLSFDDAGIGWQCLKSVTAVLWEIPEAKQAEFVDWYATHYGETVVQFAYLDDEPDPEPKKKGFDNPIGESEDPATPNVWPIHWVDAVPFGMRYSLPSGEAYHTGADLNLNEPYWDSDRLAPVYAPEDGYVIFADVGAGTWGNVLVLRHEHPAFGFVYSRHAHLDSMIPRAGATVKRGEQIGLIGNAFGQLAYHLHYDIGISAIFEAFPTDWPKLDLGRLVKNYMDPKAFTRLSRPEIAWPDPSKAYIYRNVNFRVRPTTHATSTIIRVLPKGTVVTSLNFLDDFYLIKTEDGEHGWVHQDFITDELPPPSQPTKYGIHYSTEGDRGAGWEQPTRDEMRVAPYGVIKFMSNHNPDVISQIVADNLETCETWIVRAFLSWPSGEIIGPQEFIERTLPDVQRTVNILIAHGIDPQSIIIELHNEPNLDAEGFGWSWQNGYECAVFFGTVLLEYTPKLPDGLRYGIGALSSGGAVPLVRQDAVVFLSSMMESASWSLFDVVLAHVYTSGNWEGPYEIDWIDHLQRFTGMEMWITESSYHPPETDPQTGYPAIINGNDYAEKLYELIEKLDQRPCKGVTFFAVSTDSLAFEHECWVIANRDGGGYYSRGVGARLAALASNR